MEDKLLKMCLKYCNLLIPQDLRRAHYQMLSITLSIEFIKLNINTGKMIKNMKLAELEMNIATVFLDTQT